jgi:hypothetical protein
LQRDAAAKTGVIESIIAAAKTETESFQKPD